MFPPDAFPLSCSTSMFLLLKSRSREKRSCSSVPWLWSDIPLKSKELWFLEEKRWCSDLLCVDRAKRRWRRHQRKYYTWECFLTCHSTWWVALSLDSAECVEKLQMLSYSHTEQGTHVRERAKRGFVNLAYGFINGQGGGRGGLPLLILLFSSSCPPPSVRRGLM